MTGIDRGIWHPYQVVRREGKLPIRAVCVNGFFLVCDNLSPLSSAMRRSAESGADRASMTPTALQGTQTRLPRSFSWRFCPQLVLEMSRC